MCTIFTWFWPLTLQHQYLLCLSHLFKFHDFFFFKYNDPACKICRILAVYACKNMYFAVLIQCYSYGSVFRADLLELDNLSRWSSSLKTKYLSLDNYLLPAILHPRLRPCVILCTSCYTSWYCHLLVIFRKQYCWRLVVLAFSAMSKRCYLTSGVSVLWLLQSFSLSSICPLCFGCRAILWMQYAWHYVSHSRHFNHLLFLSSLLHKELL